MTTNVGALALLVGAIVAGTASCAGHTSAVTSAKSATSPTIAPATKAEPTVRFLLVNDVYVANPLRDDSGGLSRVAALRDSIEHATGSRVIYVLGGDVLSPSLLGKWYGGRQMIDAFNASRLDFAVLGNHEFDGSRANLVARVAESKFTWMSGNCTEKGGQSFPGVRGWDTLTVNGIRIGIFGSTIVRDYPAYVQCANADSATHAMVDTLSKASAQLIVGLTHRNMADDLHTLSTEPNVQVILGGHDHNGKRGEVDGRLVIKALSNSRSAALVTFTRRNSQWERRDTSFTIGPAMRQDGPTEAVVTVWNDSLRRRIGPDRVIGASPDVIDATDSTQHKGESVFGDFVADGLRIGTKADVGMINSGAMRFDDFIAPGPITSHMIESVFLFADETRAVSFNMTGARLREELEHGVAKSSLGQGAFLQLSGVNYTYDTGRPDGQRIVGALRRDNGRVIGDAEMLRVTMVTYPACRSGDGYKFPEAAAVCKALEADPTRAPRTVDLVIQHIEGSGGQIALPKVGRVLRVSR